jgi:hypothetical protein
VVFKRSVLVGEMGAGFEYWLAFEIGVNGADKVARDVAGE